VVWPVGWKTDTRSIRGAVENVGRKKEHLEWGADQQNTGKTFKPGKRESGKATSKQKEDQPIDQSMAQSEALGEQNPRKKEKQRNPDRGLKKTTRRGK